MKYAELKADNERLRTQLADLVNAVAALRAEMEHERDSRMVHGNPQKWSEADGIKWAMDKLASILDSRKG